MSTLPSMPKNYQDFAVSLLFVVVLPLIPVGIEQWVKGVVGPNSLTLAAAMYALSIGASSKSPLLMALGVLSSLSFAMLFGVTLASTVIPAGVDTAAFASMAFVAVVHGCERWNRHACDHERFLDY